MPRKKKGHLEEFIPQDHEQDPPDPEGYEDPGEDHDPVPPPPVPPPDHNPLDGPPPGMERHLSDEDTRILVAEADEPVYEGVFTNTGTSKGNSKLSLHVRKVYPGLASTAEAFNDLRLWSEAEAAKKLTFVREDDQSVRWGVSVLVTGVAYSKKGCSLSLKAVFEDAETLHQINEAIMSEEDVVFALADVPDVQVTLL